MKISNELLRNYQITRRSFILMVGKLSLLFMLSLRMLYMQIVDGSRYRTLSDKNRISVVMLHPPRGKIIDRHGRVIATNTSAFRVMLDKKENPKYKKTIHLLGKILDIPENDQTILLKVAERINKRCPSALIDNLSWQQVSVIEENIADLPGIYVDVGQYRSYPYGSFISHPIGYIGTITEQDKKELSLSNVGDFAVGRTGVEKFYEESLQGTFGVQEVEVNAHGTFVREISSKNSLAGNDIKLNIDAELQSKAMGMLSPKGSSAIVLDLEYGKVLTMASSPGFDPNQFVGGVSHNYWNSVNNDHHKPLVNKPLQNNYPPGSIFKMVVVLAALEAGMDPTAHINCTGASSLGDTHFKCWYKPGHGNMDMHSAIEHSCNTYMFHIAKTIGAEKIAVVARKFGFGKPTGIDLSSESAGLVPDALWKKERFKQEWRLGDSLNTAIGQGFTLATPLQIARFCAAIATKGKLLTPRIAGHADYSQIDVEPSHIEFLQSAMNNVMNSPGGTAYSHRIIEPKWMIAGKTGTCQVKSKVGNIDQSGGLVSWEERNHAVFTCYGPIHDPRYASCVLVDHGGGGSVAAAIAKNIMLEVFRNYL